MHNHIKSWVDHISKPREELGGYSVCPFAKSAKFEIIKCSEEEINPPNKWFELLIYKMPDELTESQLDETAKRLKQKFQDYIFLPDHRERNTFINGVQTNNGKLNLILCQWKTDLESARDKLTKTKYYSYWDKEYLKEIWSA